MSFYPEQSDIDVLFQHQKHIYSKVEILDSNYLVVNNVEGELISDDFNVDASSNIRRSYSCVIQVESSTLDFSKSGIIWFDKYIRPYVGIYNNSKKEIVWYLKGTFSSVNASATYSATDNTLSLSCNDLMCRLTGDLDGVVPLDEYETGGFGQFVIPAGSDIAETIVGIIKQFGFTEYNIEKLPRTVQYDLEFPGGTTAYDMISKLMEFCPNYEFFFDLYGVFTVQRIPCYTDDGNILDNHVIDKLLIEESSYTVNFNAKNCIEVWGKNYDDNSVDRFAEKCEYDTETNTYNAVFEEWNHEDAFTVTKKNIPDTISFRVDEEKFRKHIYNQSNSYTAKYYPGEAFIDGYWILTLHNDSNILVRELPVIEWRIDNEDAEEVWGITYNLPAGEQLSEDAEFEVSLMIPEVMPYNNMVFAAKIEEANQDNFKMSISGVDSGLVDTYEVVDDYGRGITAGTLKPNTTYIFMFETTYPFGGIEEMSSPYPAATTKESETVFTTIGWNIVDGVTKYAVDLKHYYCDGWQRLVPRGGGEEKWFYFESNGSVATDYYPFAVKKLSSNPFPQTEWNIIDGNIMYATDSTHYLSGGWAKLEPQGGGSKQWFYFTVNGTLSVGKILYLGNIAIHAIYENHDQSKFSVEDMGKKYWAVFSDGEYSNINSNALAEERAMYECYYKGNLSETLSLNLIDIPWLDVNKKIQYKRINTVYNENTWVSIDSPEIESDTIRIVKDIGGSLHKRSEPGIRSLDDVVNPSNGDYIYIDGVKYIYVGVERWLINSISSQTLSGTVNVSLSKFYPDWSEIFHRD